MLAFPSRLIPASRVHYELSGFVFRPRFRAFDRPDYWPTGKPSATEKTSQLSQNWTRGVPDAGAIRALVAGQNVGGLIPTGRTRCIR